MTKFANNTNTNHGQKKEHRHGIINLTLTPAEYERRRQRHRDGDSNNKKLQATVSRNASNRPLIATIKEDKGLFEHVDEYEKYSQDFDGFADQLLISNGATITYSGITLTDSMGRNRTLVRRKEK